jgi:hypothetical protein
MGWLGSGPEAVLFLGPGEKLLTPTQLHGGTGGGGQGQASRIQQADPGGKGRP